MNKQTVIDLTKDYVRRTLEADRTGHDWWHVYRVWKNAIQIGKEENADLFIVQLGALLHDIADWKFNNGDESVGVRTARCWLERLEVNDNIISHVCTIVQEISFKGAGVKSRMKTKEGMVVQDADRLDAIGAIGVARTFAYGGYKGKAIYDPLIKPKKHKSFDEYKNNECTTINHFYEKLLLLKGLMNTETAKRIAEGRHRFLEEFIDRFLNEWNGG